MQRLYPKYCKKVLENPFAKGNCAKCEHPETEKEEIKGIKVCRQANAKWEESFDERVNPHGKNTIGYRLF